MQSLKYFSSAQGAISAILFAGDDSVVGAYGSASAAIDASIGIDVIDFAFGNSSYGAFGETGATSYARVSDYISHS